MPGDSPNDALWSTAFARRSKRGEHGASDDFVQVRETDGALIIAIADGAGSAMRGGTGALLACAAFVEAAPMFLEIERTLSGQGLTAIDSKVELDILSAVRDAVQSQAEEEGRELMDFATTLVGAVVYETEAFFFQLGDGASVFFGEKGWETALPPAATEFVNTTHFVTSPDAPSHARIRRVDSRIDRVAVFTDGLQPLVLHSTDDRPHATFFDAVFRTLRHPGVDPDSTAWLANMLASDMVTSRTDDDTSIAIALRQVAEP